MSQEHVSGVLRSAAGSLSLLQYAIEDFTDHYWFSDDDAPYVRLKNLIAAIGECTAQAVNLADEVDQNAKQWLWNCPVDDDRGDDDDDDDDDDNDDPREPNPPQSFEKLCEREATKCGDD